MKRLAMIAALAVLLMVACSANSTRPDDGRLLVAALLGFGLGAMVCSSPLTREDIDDVRRRVREIETSIGFIERRSRL